MDPSEFLTENEFKSLSEEEQGRYVARFMDSYFEQTKDSVEASVRFAFASHYLDIAKWVFSPEQYEKEVARPAWDAAFQGAETIASIFENSLANEDLSETEKAEIRERLSGVYQLIEHKRTLEDL